MTICDSIGSSTPSECIKSTNRHISQFMLIMANDSYATLKSFLLSVSVKALNFSSRMILSNNLDCKQPIKSDKGFFRDYRGLAEQIDFPYHEIKVLGQFEQPTMRILEEWEINPNATLDKLISYLEAMDRHDIIDKIMPSLKKNVDDYIEFHNIKGSATQDFEECRTYDAYVSYSVEDNFIVSEFIEKLESTQVRLKLFIRERDIFAGCSDINSISEIEFIKNRCRHVLILLTPNFIKCTELNFLDRLIDTLTDEQKQRALIPVIWKHCEIPRILRSIPKIDFSKNDNQFWKDLMWENLINSLLPKANITMFLSSSSCNANLTTENISADTSETICGDSGVYCEKN